MAANHFVCDSQLGTRPFRECCAVHLSYLQLTNQIMLAIAWATLPDLPSYREGVIMVGLARQVHNLLAYQLSFG